MNNEKFQSLKHDAPMPGQAWTNPRRTLPFDRPSEDTNVEEYLDKIFRKLADPDVASKFLSILEAGVPIDTLVQVVIQSMVGEGKINTNMMFLMAPPLTVMMYRMAEAAGISPTLTTDDKKTDIPGLMLNLKGGKLDKATKAASISKDELVGMTRKEGLMKRPEGII